MAYKEKRYCAFCKNLRTYYMKKHLSAFDIGICALASLAVMSLVWQDLNIKVFYFFVFAVVVSEVLVRLRWRMKMICDICGFDPILYKRNRPLAAEKVKQYLELRGSDPTMLLKPYPKLTPFKKKVARVAQTAAVAKKPLSTSATSATSTSSPGSGVTKTSVNNLASSPANNSSKSPEIAK